MMKVEDKLKDAIKVAEKRLDYESAHNEELLQALGIVEEFIRRKKRVCYGGTAMNAILPSSMKFYDPAYDLPDYDFYTPTMEEDVKELVEALQAAGFKEVYNKIGIHEGTKKILVNFVAVADISAIEPELFHVLFRRSILRDGVHYTDPDILRMMMYLELSRPKGDVGRWEKVFERLQLINKIFPIRGGGKVGHRTSAPHISQPIRQIILDHVIRNQRILCNGPVESLYAAGIRRQGGAQFHLGAPGGPIFFTSPAPQKDAIAIKESLVAEKGVTDIRIFMHRARGEVVPLRMELREGNRPICLILQETACHSFHTIPTDDGRFVALGSLEFLTTLYLSLHIFTGHVEDILGGNTLGRVKRFIELMGKNYSAKHSQFPPFALTCRGHQTGFISLLRAKVERIKKARKALEERLASPPAKKAKATRKGKRTAAGKKTRRNGRNGRNKA